MKELVHRHSV